MRKFEIVYCFTRYEGKKLVPETYEDGCEKYYIDEVEAYNGNDAIERLKKQEKFITEPEIVSVKVKEEQDVRIKI